MSIRSKYRGMAGLAAALTIMALPAEGHAQSQADILTEMRRELDAVRAEQQRSNQRIAELEAALARATAAPPEIAAPAPPMAASPAPVSAATPAATASPQAAPRLALSGDVRVRYESNTGDADARNRDRGVLRARLRASYAVNKWLSLGGQLSTGDANDPNSTDITLSRFADDLTVSLDQIYMRAKLGNLQIDAGKIVQPFVRTELVWDGDVSPQGVSAAYKVPLGGSASLKATGLYFMIDEATAGPDSDMIGGQALIEISPSSDLKFELAAAYYDYSLGSVAGGDTGDFRTNLFSGGRYLSDFNMLDVIAAANWQGLGAKWPVRIVGDYVKNYGAATAEDSGFGVDLIVGRASKPGDLRFTYGYAEVGTDAVVAAFSHDNTNIATNYRQHTFGIDYTIATNFLLNATYYFYRPLHALHAGTNDPSDWLNRLRLNLLVTF